MSGTHNSEQNQKTIGSRLLVVLFLFTIVCIFAVILWPGIKRDIHHSRSKKCSKNILELGNSLYAYAQDHDGRYPNENWCDLVLEGGYATKKQFVCPYGKKAQCHYAMNRNVIGLQMSKLPNDIVVLFETEGGWNQVGGPELLTTKNHFGQGCTILFNGRYAMFNRTIQFGQLKWKAEEDGSGGKSIPE
ncbi:MAG: hypothetical protein ACFFEL_16740 [Candidatus Thorarchaeota archaeon]